MQVNRLEQDQVLDAIHRDDGRATTLTCYLRFYCTKDSYSEI